MLPSYPGATGYEPATKGTQVETRVAAALSICREQYQLGSLALHHCRPIEAAQLGVGTAQVEALTEPSSRIDDRQ